MKRSLTYSSRFLDFVLYVLATYINHKRVPVIPDHVAEHQSIAPRAKPPPLAIGLDKLSGDRTCGTHLDIFAEAVVVVYRSGNGRVIDF